MSNGKDIGLLYIRELRSALRERNIVINSILLPIFLYPALLYLAYTGISFAGGQTEKAPRSQNGAGGVPGRVELPHQHQPDLRALVWKRNCLVWRVFSAGRSFHPARLRTWQLMWDCFYTILAMHRQNLFARDPGGYVRVRRARYARRSDLQFRRA